MVPYYVKPAFFELRFGEQHWTVSSCPTFCFMELSNDLLGLEITNSNLFNITVNMTYGNTNLEIALFPLWNSYQLPHHRHHATVGIYTEWENSVKPATHGPTLTVNTKDRHVGREGVFCGMRIAECRKLSTGNLRKIWCGFFSAEWRVKCGMKVCGMSLEWTFTKYSP